MKKTLTYQVSLDKPYASIAEAKRSRKEKLYNTS